MPNTTTKVVLEVMDIFWNEQLKKLEVIHYVVKYEKC